MTIFVAGAHGAGKTFATKPACEALGLVHATASQLIRQERGLASWNDAKVVAEVEANQQALVAAAARIREAGRNLVLDGHFVLRRAPGVHEKLDTKVFRALGCTSVLLFQCPVTVMLQRLEARQDMSWSAAELTAFSQAEASHAGVVAEALGIELIRLDMPQEAEVCSALVRLSHGHHGVKVDGLRQASASGLSGKT